MSFDISTLKSLSVAEKLQIVELLWEDISTAKEPIELSPTQFDEVDRRSNELKSDPSIAIDRDELWRRVDG